MTTSDARSEQWRHLRNRRNYFFGYFVSVYELTVSLVVSRA